MYVWIVLLAFVGFGVYFLRGISHPQKIQYPASSIQEKEQNPSIESAYMPFSLSQFDPFHKSHKASHLHHLHSIKSKEHILSSLFPNEKVQKSTTPNTQHLQKLVNKHQRHKNQKRRVHSHVKKTQEKVKPKPLHAIEKMGLVEELRQIVNKK